MIFKKEIMLLKIKEGIKDFTKVVKEILLLSVSPRYICCLDT